MNRKVIAKHEINGKKINHRRSYVISTFLDNKVCDLLKCDSKKILTDESEWNGKLNRCIIALIRADLKARNLL